MQFEWSYFFSLFSLADFWKACVTVIELSTLAWFIGMVLGFLLASARLSTHPLLRVPVGLYIWFFRGTPLLVQLIFWYNLSTLFPKLSVGIPFGPTLWAWKTNDVITPLTAAIAGLALKRAA